MTTRLLAALSLAACSAQVPEPPATWSVTSDGSRVTAGAEATRCFFARLPSQPIAITRFTVVASIGTHHLAAYLLPGDAWTAGAGACPRDGMLTTLLVGAQSPRWDVRMPTGVALAPPAASWIVLQHHVVNASLADAEVSATMTLEEGSGALTPAGWWLGNYEGGIDLPPHTGGSYTATCNNVSGNFFLFSSHAHRHLTRFTGTLGSDAIYDSTDWDTPTVVDLSSAPLVLDGTRPLTWTCAYRNDSTVPVHQGGSALDEEMCVFSALYYPAEGATVNCNSP